MFQKTKQTGVGTGLFLMALNDEHQGEGGTLVFVDQDNTISQKRVQACSIRLMLEDSVPRAGIEPTSKP